MTIFKFTPDLMHEEDLLQISVGRKNLVEEITKKIENAARKNLATHIVIIGERGMGKTHTLLTIYYKLKKNNLMEAVRLSEEEYSITSIENFFARILDEMCEEYNHDNIVDDALKIFDRRKHDGKTIIIVADNLQMLFQQMEKDLPKLRSILQEKNPFCILSSALSIFHEISSHDEPFYNFLDVIILKGLTEDEIAELIRKRFEHAGMKDVLNTVSHFKERIKGIQILTGGNPRLVHSLCEIMLQKGSIENMEKNLFDLLDQLTPYYQARMESLTVEKRKLIDTLAQQGGPISPTELAKKLDMKSGIVVTQLRRLEDEGIVESFKFRDKKTTAYQIKERLYRIWREMRSPVGLKKITLFVNFLKIWYTPSELMDEFLQTSKHFEKALVFSKTEARKSLTELCYVVESLPNLKLFEAPNMVERYVRIGDIDSAKNEIKNAKKVTEKITQIDIKLMTEISTLIAELFLDRSQNNGMLKDKLNEQLDNKINLLDKLDVEQIQKDELHLFLFHEMYHMLSSYFFNTDELKRAEKYVNLSLKQHPFCTSAMKEKTRILIGQNRLKDALDTFEKIPLAQRDADGQVLMIGSKAELKQMESAQYDAENLLKSDLESLPRIIDIFGSINYDMAEEFVKQNIPRISKMTGIERDHLVVRIQTQLVHILFHALEKKDMIMKEKFSILAKELNKMMPLEQSLRIISPTFREITVNKQYELFLELVEYLKSMDIINSDELEPMLQAVNFILTKNTDILEKLHKESRSLVIDILRSIEPNLEISAQIYDSI